MRYMFYIFLSAIRIFKNREGKEILFLTFDFLNTDYNVICAFLSIFNIISKIFKKFFIFDVFVYETCLYVFRW